MDSGMALLEQLADRIAGLADRIAGLAGRAIVATDGVDGSGKTTFADALALPISRRGRAVIRASVDGFHNPRPCDIGLAKPILQASGIPTTTAVCAGI